MPRLRHPSQPAPHRATRKWSVLAKLLVRYLKQYRWLLVGVLLFQFVSAMASLYLPRLNADIIDQGVARGDTAYIWSTGSFMLAISPSSTVFDATR